MSQLVWDDIKLSDNEKCSEWQMNQEIYKETYILLISRSNPDRELIQLNI